MSSVTEHILREMPIYFYDTICSPQRQPYLQEPWSEAYIMHVSDLNSILIQLEMVLRHRYRGIIVMLLLYIHYPMAIAISTTSVSLFIVLSMQSFYLQQFKYIIFVDVVMLPRHVVLCGMTVHSGLLSETTLSIRCSGKVSRQKYQLTELTFRIPSITPVVWWNPQRAKKKGK